MVAPKVELISRWRLEEECYHKVVIKDILTGKTVKWPRLNPSERIVFEQWLYKVVDPDTGFYYPREMRKASP